MKMRRMFAIVLCLILLFALLAGCSAPTGSSGDMYY